MSSILKIKGRGRGIKFQRVRRVTGYINVSLDNWNYAKKSEEADRVKHYTAGGDSLCRT